MKNTITIKEQSYELKYDFNALCLAEDILNKPILSNLESNLQSLNSLSAIIWAGLQHKHSEKFSSVNVIKKNLDLKDLSSIVTAVSIAFADSLGSEEEGKPQEVSPQLENQ